MKLSDLKSFSTADLNKKLDQKYGFKIKTAGLSESKARDLLAKVQENIVAYKRKFGHVLSEKNGQFMQLLVMKEGLQRWLVENNHVIINEGEMQQAETILAAKDIVDRLQKMVEDKFIKLHYSLLELTSKRFISLLCIFFYDFFPAAS